jgi:hypothetical protein
MFSIRKSVPTDENILYAPIKPQIWWYVTENPYIPLYWGVLQGYLRVMEGMCPIYTDLGVI